MTKTAVTLRGMARKRERHMPLRPRLIGQCFVATGTLLLLILTLIWSQYLFPTMLDAHVAFDAVLNQYDELTDDWTFRDFEYTTSAREYSELSLACLGTGNKMKPQICLFYTSGM